jgi:hypothetical protein
MLRIKKVESIVIELDGVVIDRATRFGRGRFTTAYRSGNTVYTLVRGDYTKEAVWLYAGKSIHIPQTEQIGSYEVRPVKGEAYDMYVYRMPYYDKLTATSKEAWAQFKVLAKLWDQAYRTAIAKYPKVPSWCYGEVLQVLNCLVQESELPDSLKEAFESVADAGASYGAEIGVEILRRNLKVDSSGNLILLDILFDYRKMR